MHECIFYAVKDSHEFGLACSVKMPLHVASDKNATGQIIMHLIHRFAEVAQELQGNGSSSIPHQDIVIITESHPSSCGLSLWDILTEVEVQMTLRPGIAPSRASFAWSLQI